ncbi:hypothetical protein MMC27_004665 [Xylographa pallens]|nr:hypothetical protein [Xylographa pallens]
MFENRLPTTCHNIQLGTLYNVEDCNGVGNPSPKTTGLQGSKRSKQNQRRTNSSTDVEEYFIISDTYLEVDEILTHIALSHRLRELAELVEQYQAFSALCKARIRQTDQVPTRDKVWDKIHPVFVKRIEEILQSFEKNRIIQDILFAAEFMTGPEVVGPLKFWKEDASGCDLNASRYFVLCARMDRTKKREKINRFVKGLEQPLLDVYPVVSRDMETRRIQLSAVVESGIEAAAKAVGSLPLGSRRR